MNRRLMIIEDNLDLLDIYQACLKNEEIEVLCAPNGAEALSHILDFQPQIVLCDLKMPHLTGFDVIEMINSQPKLKAGTRVIIMSAYDDPPMLTRAAKLGISRERYLVKSQVTLNQVLGIIRANFQLA